MPVTGLISDMLKYWRLRGARGLRHTVQDFSRGAASRLGMLSPPPMDNVLNKDFDLLLVLDACRYDLMAGVHDEYDWTGPLRPFWSASSSQEWIARTFMERESTLPRAVYDIWRDQTDPELYAKHFRTRDMRDVSYITWNPFSPMLDGDRFHHLEEVWRYKAGDEIVEPRDVTDRVISHMREDDHDRTVVHYQQPHLPFRRDIGVDIDGSAWELYQLGELAHEDMWDMYEDNLRWVMDDIELLLENVDAGHVAITADHGNALGERGFYGHFPYTNSIGMRKVPWIDVGSAEDEEAYTPGSHREIEIDTEERLEYLGYK